jgi:undecaprenyl-diphosphatase
MEPGQAVMLGLVEGITEFLPVSSTGHLILAARWLKLQGEAVDTFAVVIQAGALGAVVGLYRARVAAMWRGLLGRDAAGWALLLKLLLSFLPAAVAGLLLHRLIKAWLFDVWPVVAALARGGVAMIALDRRLRARGRGESGPAMREEDAEGGRRAAKTLDALTFREALVIGCAQCLALWPGTSRAMVTILAGMLVGLPATAAAEYSFLLALPTLGAATVLGAFIGGEQLVQQVGMTTTAAGFAAAAVVAALAMRGLVRYLTRHGLALFGWYRLGLAAVVWIAARGG